MRITRALALWSILGASLLAVTAPLPAQAQQALAQPPIYLWYEPEWFPGVEGGFGYWTGTAKPTGTWGVAGPGITAEWSQGGESEWNSMGAPAAETKAACGRDIVVPRAGKYKLWVRYVDHREQTEPFTVRLTQNGKNAITGELGVKPAVPANDEYMLYWGFSFGWAALEGNLAAGPANLQLIIDKAGEGWRQLDAVLITDDLNYTPIAREKPRFAYYDSFKTPAAVVGAVNPSIEFRTSTGPVNMQFGKRKPLGGRDFSMWPGIGTTGDWWAKQNIETTSVYDVFFQFGPPRDIADKFHKQYAGRKDLPILSWPGLRPGLYLGETPDLSPETPLRRWLDRTKTPFYIGTNYAQPKYDEKTGPATYQALSGALSAQFLGYIHGEAFGTPTVGPHEEVAGRTRRAYIDAMGANLLKRQAEQWSKIYKTAVPESWMSKSISCLSVDSIAVAHLYQQIGSETIGYELDATNANAPLRIAFERGAARQYGRNWINYASANFGDACNYFTQDPITPRGAKGWFHSKYAVTDGVPISWYRKFYYLNYLGGASAIHWEQGLGNQWMMPGPGTHPVQLSPFGRATIDFQNFVDRLPDRGEPYTPIGFLLSYGHGYEPVNYACKMLDKFTENIYDRELRELFSVAYAPAGELESRPITPDSQSLTSGTYGNIFDVLVDRPEHTAAFANYPVLYAAGDVELGGKMAPVIEAYVKSGGTLVVNVEAARGKVPAALTGVKLSGQKKTFNSWTPEGGTAQQTTPFQVETATLDGAKALAWAEPGVPLITRRTVGKGAVILTLVPNMLGLDERAHPALPFLMNGLTENLLPVRVRLPNGERPNGEVMYQVNRTKDGLLVMLMNNRGVDKTQNGIARVERRASAEIVIDTSAMFTAAKEITANAILPMEAPPGPIGFYAKRVTVQVPPGDLKVIHFSNVELVKNTPFEGLRVGSRANLSNADTYKNIDFYREAVGVEF